MLSKKSSLSALPLNSFAMTTKLLSKVQQLKSKVEEAKKLARIFENVKYFKNMICDKDERLDFLSQACQHVKQTTYSVGSVIHGMGDFNVCFGIIHTGSAFVYTLKDEDQIRRDSINEIKCEMVERYVNFINQQRGPRRSTRATPLNRTPMGGRSSRRSSSKVGFSEAIKEDEEMNLMPPPRGQKGSARKSRSTTIIRTGVRQSTIAKPIQEFTNTSQFDRILEEMINPRVRIISDEMKQAHGDLSVAEKLLILNAVLNHRKFVRDGVILFEQVTELQAGDSFQDIALIKDTPTKTVMVAGSDQLHILNFTKDDYRHIFNKRIACIAERKKFLEFIFPNLSLELISKISYYLKEREFGGYETIYNEGDTPDHIYLLRSGEVQLIKSINEDKRDNIPNSCVIKQEGKKKFVTRRKIVVGSIQAGGTFGEYETIKGKQRLYTAKTTSGTTVCYILPKNTYFDIFEKYLPYAVNCFVSLTKKKLKWRFQREVKEQEMTNIILGQIPVPNHPEEQQDSPKKKIPSPSKSRLFSRLREQKLNDIVETMQQSKANPLKSENNSFIKDLEDSSSDEYDSRNASILTELIQKKTFQYSERFKSRPVNQNIIVSHYNHKYDKLKQKKLKESWKMFDYDVMMNSHRPARYFQNKKNLKNYIPKKIKDRIKSKSRDATPSRLDVDEKPQTIEALETQEDSPLKLEKKGSSQNQLNYYQRKTYAFNAPINWMDPDLAAQRIIRMTSHEAKAETISKIKLNDSDSELLEDRDTIHQDLDAILNTEPAPETAFDSATKKVNKSRSKEKKKSRPPSVEPQIVKQRPQTANVLLVKSYKNNYDSKVVKSSQQDATANYHYLPYYNLNTDRQSNESFQRWRRTTESSFQGTQHPSSLLQNKTISKALKDESLADRLVSKSKAFKAPLSRRESQTSKSVTEILPTRPNSARPQFVNPHARAMAEQRKKSAGPKITQFSRSNSHQVLPQHPNSYRELPKDIQKDSVLKSPPSKKLGKESVNIFKRILTSMPSKDEDVPTEYGIINPATFSVRAMNRDSLTDRTDNGSPTKIINDYALYQQQNSKEVQAKEEVILSKVDKSKFFIDTQKALSHRPSYIGSQSTRIPTSPKLQKQNSSGVKGSNSNTNYAKVLRKSTIG